MNIKISKSIKKLTAGTVIASVLLTTNAQARSLLYGMEKQVSLHTTQTSLKTKVFDEESSQRFYGGKGSFRVEPKVKGATLGASYNLVGSKTLTRGGMKFEPTVHSAFIDLGYKSSTRARLVSTVFSLGVGNVVISGDKYDDDIDSGFSSESTPAAKAAIIVDRKFGQFSPWSIQFAAELVRLLENSDVINSSIYSTSVGIGYRF